MTSAEQPCEACGNTADWHTINQPHHPFSAKGSPVQLLEQPDDVQRAPISFSGDLVLRLTLMKLGLVSDRDLSHTRHMVEMASQQKKSIVVKPDPDSKSGFKLSLMSLEDMLAEDP
jgi:hypothetical protein